jgi:peptidyl-prolyl cis-trans isomerase-like protein 2
VPIAKLPFSCCALSLLPFENPVCTIEGDVFDVMIIVLDCEYHPFFKKIQEKPRDWKRIKTLRPDPTEFQQK